MAARLGLEVFGVLYLYDAGEELQTIAERIQKRIDAINQVDGFSCTIFAKRIDAINQVDGFSCTIFARVRILPAEEAVHFRQKLLRAVLQETDRE